MPKLSSINIQEALQSIDAEWQLKDDSINRAFKFKDFISAFSFISAIALKAEALQHHPDWENSYNKVDIKLSTHDVGGLSTKDFELASVIDNFYSALK